MASSSSMDWDKFIEDGSEMERTLRELSSRLGQQNVASRSRRTRAAVRDVKRLRADAARDRDVRDAVQSTPRPLLVRETPPDNGDMRLVLAEIRQDVLMLRRDVIRMRELMATKAEVESIRDDIRLVADGFGQTQQRMQDVASLLRRFITEK